MLFDEGLEPVFQPLGQIADVLINLRMPVQDFQLGKSCRHGDGISGQSARLIDLSGGRNGFHKGPAAAVSAHRHSAADDFPEGDKIGPNAKILLCAAF